MVTAHSKVQTSKIDAGGIDDLIAALTVQPLREDEITVQALAERTGRDRSVCEYALVKAWRAGKATRRPVVFDGRRAYAYEFIK